MSFTSSPRYRAAAVIAFSLVTVAFHYGLILRPSHGDPSLFHAIHGRLCYIPIILGAIWFGVRGGLGIGAFHLRSHDPVRRVGSARDTTRARRANTPR